MRTFGKVATALLLLTVLISLGAATDADDTTITLDSPTGDTPYSEYGSDDTITFSGNVDGPAGEVELYVDSTLVATDSSKSSGSVDYDIDHTVSGTGSHTWDLRYNGPDGSTTYEQESFDKLDYAESADAGNNEILSPNEGESEDDSVYLEAEGDIPPGTIYFMLDGDQVDSSSRSGGEWWQSERVSASPGEHTFKLEYEGDDGSYVVLDSVDFYADTEPTADFSFNPSNPNEDETVDFSDQSTDGEGDIQDYAWSFDDGSTSSSQNPSHSFDSGGSYNVELEVTDSRGLTDTYTQYVDVNNDPNADFYYAPSDPHTEEEINFYSESSDPDGSNDIESYEWDFGDGGTDSGDIATHTFYSPGTYDVTLTVTDGNGATDTYTQTVDVDEPNEAPSSDFSYTPSDPLTGESIDFSEQASDSDGHIDSYDWTWDDGSFSTSANPSHTYDSSGTYNVELTVTDNDGATDSYSETITVEENTPPNADFSYTPTLPVEGTQVEFSDESTDSENNIDSWSWDFGDGGTSDSQNPSHVYSSSGNYTVELVVTDDLGESDTVTKEVQVDEERPIINDALFVDNRKTGDSELSFSLDENGNSNLDGYSGPGSLLEFTNSTLSLEISTPFSGSWSVTSFDGTSSNSWNLDIETSDTGIREHDHSHNLTEQRLNKTIEVSNTGGNSLEYNLTMQNYGDTISGEQTVFDVPADETVSKTGIWSGDWITGEEESEYAKGQNQSESSNFDEQHIYNQTQLVVDNEKNFSFTGVDISSICSTTGSADVPSGESTVTESCNNESYSGDWISDVSTYTIEQGQNSSAKSTMDTQYLADQTGLKANSSLGFELPAVDVSSQCEDAETASVPSGFNNVTKSCSVDSEQGDWIQNEEVYNTKYSSESVVYGGGIQDTYTAVQNIYAENQRTDLDLAINFTGQIETVEGCSLDGSAEKTIPAVTGANKSFFQSCNPGKEIGYIPVQKTATGDKTKHNLTTKVQVFTNLTDEQSQWIGIPKDRLDNFEDRNAGETEAFVNGRDTDVSVEQGVENGTEYVFIIVGDEYGDSSLHAGNHTASLIYYQGGTGDSDSGTGSASPGQVIDEVEGEDYSWTLSNPQSEDSAGSGIQAIPGREFERRLVVENQGDNPVTLDLQCVSESDSCDWVAVSVDRIELEAGEGSTQTFQVRGQVPESATPEDTFRFSVRVSDPSYDESTPSTAGSADADYVVNINPFLGSVITGVDKILSLREISPPWDGAAPIPYPFVFIPLFGGGSVFAGLGKAMGMAGFDRSESALVSFFVGFAVFIVVTLVA